MFDGTAPPPGGTTVVPGDQLHKHAGRQVLIEDAWAHLLWADPENNGLLLRVRTAERGLEYLSREGSYQVRGEREMVVLGFEPGQRELLEELLSQVDAQIAAGDFADAANALDLLAQHAEQCAASLRARGAALGERWDNETPTDTLP